MVAQLRPRRRAQLFQHAVPTKLVHEVGNHAMEVEAVVEAGVGEVDEVRGRHRHLIEVDLACDVARRGLERGRGVGHCFGLLRQRSRVRCLAKNRFAFTPPSGSRLGLCSHS